MSAPIRDHVEAAGLVVLSFKALYWLTGKPEGLLVSAAKNAGIGAVAGGAAVSGFVYAGDALTRENNLPEQTAFLGGLGALSGGLLGLAGTFAWAVISR